MPLTLAIPKGRILEELLPVLQRAGIEPEAKFFDKKDRSLQFATNLPELRLIRVRSFDVATLVAYGGAQLGVAGSDVLEEFDYPDLYTPLDLALGACRLSIALPASLTTDYFTGLSHLRVATKYPRLTQRHFAERGIQAECIKLNGAMELAPAIGLCDTIVDLVSTGATLKANGLKEVETILPVSSRLIVQRSAYKTNKSRILELIDALAKGVA